MRFDGKTVVIVGAGDPVGRACAVLFAAEGAHVLAVDRPGEGSTLTLERITADGGRVTAVDCDPADFDALAAAAARCTEDWGAAHALVVYYFGLGQGTIEDSSLSDWERVTRLNLLGPVASTKAFLPMLKQASGAAIVHIGSVDGLLGNPRFPAYSATKGGVIPLTHVMAHEFAKYDIRVNCVARALLTEDDGRLPANDYTRQLLDATPLGRAGTPGELAHAVAFFASPDSSYVTGAVLVVDGGRTGVTPGTAP
jgi:NAD(P)-dependent dehydrogenase (short-subunit alcohol dehydrogenase family)